MTIEQAQKELEELLDYFAKNADEDEANTGTTGCDLRLWVEQIVAIQTLINNHAGQPPIKVVVPDIETGIELIAKERQRQIEVEGWTPEHDAEHADGELGDAAMCYIGTTLNEFAEYSGELSEPPYAWPWSNDWWKPSDDPVRNLVKAGALIAAEIDRIKRGETK
jgi:hypothetical protein